MEYFSHAWLPFIYQYVAGALIFGVGLFITLRAGSFDLSRRRHRRWLVVLILGFVWYLVIHGGLTLAALGHERSAAIGSAVVMVIACSLSIFCSRRAGGER